MLKSFKGKLLVAHPQNMSDPRFAETVVYIYEHADNVVLGLVLNKPSTMSVADLHSIRGYHNSGATGKMHKGGPVSDQSLLLLHTDDWYSTNTFQTTHGNAISSDELMLEKMVNNNTPACWRLMAGICTWTYPQLCVEVYKHHAWLVVEPNEEIFYNFDELEQWQAAIDLASSRMVESFF